MGCVSSTQRELVVSPSADDIVIANPPIKKRRGRRRRRGTATDTLSVLSLDSTSTSPTLSTDGTPNGNTKINGSVHLQGCDIASQTVDYGGAPSSISSSINNNNDASNKPSLYRYALVGMIRQPPLRRPPRRARKRLEQQQPRQHPQSSGALQLLRANTTDVEHLRPNPSSSSTLIQNMLLRTLFRGPPVPTHCPTNVTVTQPIVKLPPPSERRRTRRHVARIPEWEETTASFEEAVPPSLMDYNNNEEEEVTLAAATSTKTPAVVEQYPPVEPYMDCGVLDLITSTLASWCQPHTLSEATLQLTTTTTLALPDSENNQIVARAATDQAPDSNNNNGEALIVGSTNALVTKSVPQQQQQAFEMVTNNSNAEASDREVDNQQEEPTNETTSPESAQLRALLLEATAALAQARTNEDGLSTTTASTRNTDLLSVPSDELQGPYTANEWAQDNRRCCAKGGYYLIHQTTRQGGRLKAVFSRGRRVPRNAVGFWCRPPPSSSNNNNNVEIIHHSKLFEDTIGCDKDDDKYCQGWCVFLQMAALQQGSVIQFRAVNTIRAAQAPIHVYACDGVMTTQLKLEKDLVDVSTYQSFTVARKELLLQDGPTKKCDSTSRELIAEPVAATECKSQTDDKVIDLDVAQVESSTSSRIIPLIVSCLPTQSCDLQNQSVPPKEAQITQNDMVPVVDAQQEIEPQTPSISPTSFESSSEIQCSSIEKASHTEILQPILSAARQALALQAQPTASTELSTEAEARGQESGDSYPDEADQRPKPIIGRMTPWVGMGRTVSSEEENSIAETLSEDKEVGLLPAQDILVGDRMVKDEDVEAKEPYSTFRQTIKSVLARRTASMLTPKPIKVSGSINECEERQIVEAPVKTITCLNTQDDRSLLGAAVGANQKGLATSRHTGMVKSGKRRRKVRFTRGSMTAAAWASEHGRPGFYLIHEKKNGGRLKVKHGDHRVPRHTVGFWCAQDETSVEHVKRCKVIPESVGCCEDEDKYFHGWGKFIEMAKQNGGAVVSFSSKRAVPIEVFGFLPNNSNAFRLNVQEGLTEVSPYESVFVTVQGGVAPSGTNNTPASHGITTLTKAQSPIIQPSSLCMPLCSLGGGEYHSDTTESDDESGSEPDVIYSMENDDYRGLSSISTDDESVTDNTSTSEVSTDSLVIVDELEDLPWCCAVPT